MMKRLPPADQQRRDRERAVVREREMRRFLITLFVGAMVFVVLTKVYPSTDRGPAFLGLLGLGLVLAFLLAQLVDRFVERRRLDRLAASRDRRP